MNTPAWTRAFGAALYQATERIWKQSLDALLELERGCLNWDALRMAREEFADMRSIAFSLAFEQAYTATSSLIAQQAEYDILFHILATQTSAFSLETFCNEAAKLMLFSAFPDEARLSKLCQFVLPDDKLFGKESNPQTLAYLLSELLVNLRYALLNQDIYHELVQPQTRQFLVEIVNSIRPLDHDTEETYRNQLAALYRNVDVVGIPLASERRTGTVTDLFVPLWLHREAHILPVTEVLLAMQTGSEAIHPKDLRKQEKGEKEALATDEAAQKAARLVILGPPGSGKTMLLKYLAVMCAKGQLENLWALPPSPTEPLLPIIISLREYATQLAQQSLDYGLIHHFYTDASEHMLFIPPYGFFEHSLESGRCLVCLDGLNEIWDKEQRKMVCAAIQALVIRFPHNRYLITSRMEGYQETPLDHVVFDHYTIKPLTIQDSHKLIEKWYGLYQGNALAQQEWTHKLITLLHRESSVAHMAQNPLMLTIIATVYRFGLALPTSRVKWYDAYVNELIEQWKERSNLTFNERQHPFYRSLRRLMERLAYELHSRAEHREYTQTINTHELHLLFVRFLMESLKLNFGDSSNHANKEVHRFIRLVRTQSGLFVERSEELFAFPHLIFQEYLTACDIEHRCIYGGVDALWNEIKERLHDPHWQEVILLLFQNLNKYDELPNQLTKSLLRAGEQDRLEPFLHRHLYLVTRILANHVSVASDIHQKVITALLEIVRCASWNEQQDALHALAQLTNDSTVEFALMELANDSKLETATRLDAAETLGKLGYTDHAVEALWNVIREPMSEPWQFRSAAMLLGKFGHTDEAIHILLNVVQDSQASIRERCSAAIALGSFDGADQAVDVLLAIARDTQSDAGTRRQAAEALGMLGKIELAIDLLQELAQHPLCSAWQRRYVAEALGAFGQRDEAVNMLLALISEPHAEARVRRFAIESLGTLGYVRNDVLQHLLMRAKKPDCDAWELSTIAIALGKLEQENEAKTLLRAIIHDAEAQHRVRRTAAMALGAFGHTEEAVQTLLEIARDKQGDPWERCTTAIALGTFGSIEKDVLDGLVQLAQNARLEDDERCTAAVALGTLGRSKEAVEVLLALARNPHISGWMRRVTYDILKRLATPPR